MKVVTRPSGLKRGRPKRRTSQDFDAGVLKLLEWAQRQVKIEGVI